ncbi:MAG: hypothetical protein HUJ90_08280, partial [Bacteroidales bacterium]|nr:hypothetical protein [Bacteroidales bacterium]
MAKKDKNIIRRRLVQSYLSSTVSISLVLFLVGVMILFGANAKSIANYFKENAVVSVILSGNATEEYALQLRDKIAEEPYVKSALYISKEQGEREMEELLGSDFLDVFEASPIPISIELNLNGEYVSKDSIAVVKDRLYQMSQVRDVSYQESLIEMLNANLEKIGLVMAVIILLLL